ncbi:hypothetical protein FNW02_36490 [Komarekiella sp. 'clone 1']|uniref:Uncharacterized protein n=1 Tax=Komarekiella delphini-convector SJRDD-AB1 TaxID=2593771 RepID=A0AA40VVJ4_9NOST|nr:hypothetical protein [Komarekiella delphini-convector]MBD6621074.1 hypothetical protein [Komarekiella delphini-convector SJRDD-AB1]
MADLEMLVNELPKLVHSLKLTIGSSHKIMEEIILINSVQEQLRNIKKLITQELKFTKNSNTAVSTSGLASTASLVIPNVYLADEFLNSKKEFIIAKFGKPETEISLTNLQAKIDYWIEWGYLIQAIATDILSDSHLGSQLDSHINYLNLSTEIQNIAESLNIDLGFGNSKLLQQQINKINCAQEELLQTQQRLNYIVDIIQNSQNMLTILLGVSCFCGKSGFALEWLDDDQELIISSEGNLQELTDILNTCDSFKEKVSNLVIHSNSLKEQAETALVNIEQKISKKTVINPQLEEVIINLPSEEVPRFSRQKIVSLTLIIASSLVVLGFGSQIINNQNPRLQQMNLTFTQEESAFVADDGGAIANFKSAQNLGMEAAALVQNPPHPLAVWQQAATKWQQAIELLESIPEETAISLQAKKQLVSYRVNYNVISKRLLTEKQAVANLESAQKLATEATFLAQNSPDSKQQVKAKWEQAINLLEAIPEGTSVFIQAKDELVVYKANYSNSNNISNFSEKSGI